MGSLVTDRVAWSVGLSLTLMSPAKAAEPIEIPFKFWARMGPRNYVLDWVQIPPWEGAILGERVAHCKVQGLSVVSCAETAIHRLICRLSRCKKRVLGILAISNLQTSEIY